MDKMLKVGQQSLMGYLPAIVIKNILDGHIDPSKKLPATYPMNTVSLFADISGFTKLSETFAKKGRIGPEFLAFSLNRYMEQLINIIGKNGGDIFKFAGDALLVVWPETKDNMGEVCRRAIQCAMDIQSKLNKVEMSPGKPLSVKIGIGVGECRVLYCGGQFKRCEYLIVGEAMRQACESETKATDGGQTICSEKVHELVSKYYEMELATGDGSHGHDDESSMKFYKITKLIGERVAIKADSYLMRTHFSAEKLREKHPLLKTFVPAAITLYLDIEKENWSKEIRMLTVMFLNLKMDLSQTKTEEGIERIQQVAHNVQRCVYRTKGSLNKFLMDDKGSVMLICWGLPPLSAPDDHVRSVLTALDLVKELKKFQVGAYIGIATGTCFTGVCGTIGGRREYSLLGEMVNLSARHMQKAIYHAKDLEKQNNSKCDYVILLCEKTRDLIQNKIICDYSCEGELKGFSNLFYFYEPLDDSKKLQPCNYGLFMQDIKTHRNNVLAGKLNPTEKSTSETMLKSALYVVGRKESIDECMSYLFNVYKRGERDFILVRGIYGSGKSLFVRKIMFDFIDSNKELKNSINNKYPFIYVTSQLPVNLYDPMNGFAKIVKEIFHHVSSSESMALKPTTFKLAGESFNISCNIIGKILLNSDCLSYVRYIEEILDTSLSKHYELPDNQVFSRFFSVKEIPPRDKFFELRKFNKFEKNICRFFCQLIKYYRENLIPEFPLILVIEDTHLIDDLSIELIRSLTISNEIPIGGICIFATYQDEINSVVKNPFDRMGKTNDLFLAEKSFLMDNLMDIQSVHDLIKQNFQSKMNITQISEKLLNIVLTKSFKGNPLFIIDIVNSLIDGQLVKRLHQELCPTDELMEMFETNDWSLFTIPIRMEKILGNLIDNLPPKEIILLKHASVIGNLFDIDKLNTLNPFNNVTFDDLYEILMNLEHHGIIEVLYDLNPKRLVCKFNIPFFREILFQRMLIEQRSDIHLNIARKMQNNKYSYMPHKQEVALLRNHLKITEKTILKHMDDKDEVDKSSLAVNNLKIILVKDICEKLKLIDLRLESDEIDFSKRSIPNIKSGILNKKSDRNITWEFRFVVLSNTRLYFWYYEEEYKENKKPLGYFFLKDLYGVEILRDKDKGDKDNLFHLQVSSHYKKDIIKGARDYYFSCPTRDELNTWVISLNFLRVKAMYDEFSSNFGLINLPLLHEIKIKNSKKFKTKFVKNASNNKLTNNTIYNNTARKSIMNHMGNNWNKTGDSSNERAGGGGSFLKRQSSIIIQDAIDEAENVDKVTKTKDLLVSTFYYSFTTFFGYFQEIIFSVDNIGLKDDELITIPMHLSKFKTLATDATTGTREPLMKLSNSVPVSKILMKNTPRNNIEEMSDEYASDDSDKFSRNIKEANIKERGQVEFETPKRGEDPNSNQNLKHLKYPNNLSSDKKNHVDISFQHVDADSVDSKHIKNKNEKNDKNFTLLSSTKKDYENLIHSKLKNIESANEDNLDEFFNSISMQSFSRDDKMKEDHKVDYTNVINPTLFKK